jgi:ribosomal protein S18 acetylase RimI-like enzyme
MPSSSNRGIIGSQNDLAQIIIDSPRDNQFATTSSSVSNNCNSSSSNNILTSNGWKIENVAVKDFDAVQQLCRDSFPLDYPESWFEEVVNGRFIAFGVYHGEFLTSLLVAELKRIGDCDPEDRELDGNPDSLVVYILSLAVHQLYRRKGIASILLDHLIKSVVNVPPYPKIVFLHVLATNYGAINFYKRSGFQHFATLANYYFIDGTYQSGCTFALYTNRFNTYSIKEFFNFIMAFLCRPFCSAFRQKLF